MFYRKANVNLVDGGVRLRLLAIVAGLLGLQFHYQGLPFGYFPNKKQPLIGAKGEQ
jgi:hypothetical protein